MSLTTPPVCHAFSHPLLSELLNPTACTCPQFLPSAHHMSGTCGLSDFHLHVSSHLLFSPLHTLHNPCSWFLSSHIGSWFTSMCLYPICSLWNLSCISRYVMVSIVDIDLISKIFPSFCTHPCAQDLLKLAEFQIKIHDTLLKILRISRW